VLKQQRFHASIVCGSAVGFPVVSPAPDARVTA